MREHVDFIQKPHTSTKRDYLARVIDGDKAENARISKQFGFDYFDGDRKYGYGGFRYDGRWHPVAAAMATHYKLEPGARILDIGCAKGFLLHDFMQVIPDADVRGIEISQYAIEHAMPSVKERIQLGTATSLPFADRSFDLVVSINTLHNLYIYDLFAALKEIERVGKAHKYVVTDSYTNEHEKVNLLNWQLTCECVFTPREWAWIYDQAGFTGDYGFVTFE